MFHDISGPGKLLNWVHIGEISTRDDIIHPVDEPKVEVKFQEVNCWRSRVQLQLLSDLGNISYVWAIPVTRQVLQKNLSHPPSLRKVHYSDVKTKLALVQKHPKRLQSQFSLSTNVIGWLSYPKSMFSKLSLDSLYGLNGRFRERNDSH